jgi:hypothetical protein
VSDDRPKLSYSERDKLLRERRGRPSEPRSRAAREEQARASEQSLKEADSLFSIGRGGAEGARLATEMRNAQGTADLAPACQTYRDQIGMPLDPALLSLFLDTQDPDLVVAALEGLLEQKSSGSLEIRSGLRSQLRGLAQDRDDTIAGISEELLQE